MLKVEGDDGGEVAESQVTSFQDGLWMSQPTSHRRSSKDKDFKIFHATRDIQPPKAVKCNH